MKLAWWFRLGLLMGTGLATIQGQETARRATLRPQDLSLEDLLKTEVTSVAKSSHSLMDTPAAVYVIEQEDIKRSGALNLPQALRLAPGVHVAQINANSWAVATRGFNDYFTNKQLVLVDGRSIYTPTFSGVYWDQQHLMLEDVDRIEVVRGPGGTIWGANAVNGVINVISKSAKETQGGYLETTGGTNNLLESALRYGGKVADNVYYRVYGKFSSGGSFRDPIWGYGADDWSAENGGGRVDWDISTTDTLTTQADFSRGYSGSSRSNSLLFKPYVMTIPDDRDYLAGNFLSRWKHREDEDTTTQVQAYYDRTDRYASSASGRNNTVDVDVTQTLRLAEINRVTVGAGYRYIDVSYDPHLIATPYDTVPDEHIYSMFLQDEIEVVDDKLFLTLGSKAEHNGYTGWVFQPSVRLLARPTEKQSFWLSISKAVRTPSQFERYGRIQFTSQPTKTGLAAQTVFYGNSQYGNEDLIAYEGGYRIQPVAQFYLDASLYYNAYTNLRTGEQRPNVLVTSPVRHIEVPLMISNRRDAFTYGGELVASWEVLTNWKLSASYDYCYIDLDADKDSTNAVALTQDPHHQFKITSSTNLPGNINLDVDFFYVDKLEDGSAPSQFLLNTRLAWQPLADLELSLVGSHLLNPTVKEFGRDDLRQNNSEIPRSIYGQISWRF